MEFHKLEPGRDMYESTTFGSPDSNLATLNRAAGIVRHDLVFTDGVWV